jgi:hypothetical protein
LQRHVPVTYDLATSVIRSEDRTGIYGGAFKKTLESGGADFRSEYRVIWPGGQIRWISSISKVRRDRDGCVPETVGTVQDIADTKQGEVEGKKLLDALQEEKDTLSAVISGRNDAVWFIDTHKKPC